MALTAMFWIDDMKSAAKTIALGISTIALLSACAASGPIYSTFSNEAGALKANDSFGLATSTNTEIMTRRVDYTIDLSVKFAQDVPTTVYFDFNSSQLDNASRTVLRKQADWINQFPEIKFKVYGHTDRVGLNAFNRSLGQRRAQAVVDYLITSGVDKSRLQAVVSEGESNPAVDARDRERLNRRAITEVSGFAAGSEPQLDGLYAAIIYRDYVESGIVPETLETVAGTVTATAGTQ